MIRDHKINTYHQEPRNIGSPTLPIGSADDSPVVWALVLLGKAILLVVYLAAGLSIGWSFWQMWQALA